MTTVTCTGCGRERHGDDGAVTGVLRAAGWLMDGAARWWCPAPACRQRWREIEGHDAAARQQQARTIEG